jgi:anti-sigma regulatory factor (Ser/Thr protein kinase)
MISAMRVPVTDSTFVGEARRAAVDFAARLGFSMERASNLAIVTTELATNILKHASSGEIVLTGVFSEHHQGVDVVALDQGPGISSIAESLRDATRRPEARERGWARLRAWRTRSTSIPNLAAEPRCRREYGTLAKPCVTPPPNPALAPSRLGA